jgi:hypothetical protein
MSILEPVAPTIVPTATSQISSVELPHHETIYGDSLGSLAATQPNLWRVPIAADFIVNEDEDTEVDETVEDDLESAFYRDLRRRQEERQKRLSARKRRC